MTLLYKESIPGLVHSYSTLTGPKFLSWRALHDPEGKPSKNFTLNDHVAGWFQAGTQLAVCRYFGL